MSDERDAEVGASAPMLSPAANGSSGGTQEKRSSNRTPTSNPIGGTIAEELTRVRANRAKKDYHEARHSLLLFDRASTRWWNPQFQSSFLETQFWKCSFPQLRTRFRSGLLYIIVTALSWFAYHAGLSSWTALLPYHVICLLIVAVGSGILGFTFSPTLYQRFYLPTSFLCTFLICVVSLLLFSLQYHPVISPLGMFATSIEVVLLLYTVIPLPLYLCMLVGGIYSVLCEVLSHQVSNSETPAVKLCLHLCIHLLGIYIFVLSQVRQRKTFLKVGESLVANKEMEIEHTFKDHMIHSVMPVKVAKELMKETTELRRPSGSADSGHKVGGVAGPGSSPGGSAPPTPGAGRPGVVSSGPLPAFRPFTMNLMTDVSILFADIAGFTKMSSNKSADDLVNLLNDLFGRFDVLCGLLGCEKISTLGDCYYCVAGCPEPKPDHARCCVEMGLAMITAIREFDEDRGQDVNMRVGIHTGTVMCGMVGTKRFKFDVFSNDVTLANDMESSGLAGRVHISQSTADFLKDEYDLEPSDPYQGLATYFIRGRKDGSSLESRTIDTTQTALKSARPEEGSTKGSSSLDDREGKSSESRFGFLVPSSQARKSSSLQALSSGSQAGVAVPGSGEGPRPQLGSISAPISGQRGANESGTALNKELANDSGSCKSGASGDHRGSRSSGLAELSEAHSRALDNVMSQRHATSLTRFETDHRDFDRKLADVIQSANLTENGYWIHSAALNPWSLEFSETKVEQAYRAHFANEEVPIGSRRRSSEDDGEIHLDAPKYSIMADIGVAVALYLILSVIAFGTFPPPAIQWLVYFILGSLVLIVLIFITGYPVLTRRALLPCLTKWVPRHFLGLLLLALPLGAGFANLPCSKDEDYNGTVKRQFVVAFVTFTALFGHCNFSQLGYWLKTLQALLFGAILVLLAQTCVCPLRPCEPSAIIFLAEHTNVSVRNGTERFAVPIFSAAGLYRWEILLDLLLAVLLIGYLNYHFEFNFRMSFYGDHQAKEDTAKMQSMKDQADWLLNNIIPQHVVEELQTNSKYSENHDQVAVLFACITNWHEMYEESYEGGREFLRVLNEIIGDFDELLDRPQFNQVEKIKTIGSTYMAAAGLNPESRKKSTNPQEHLNQLMDFAMALEETLDNFNQDLISFEFRMKIGFNVGPVTAGVIGTTKLYYDIWGDTVNISSRMYSTGVEGEIQVSEKVKKILEGTYNFKFRDHVDVKGIEGGMDVFLLERERPSRSI